MLNTPSAPARQHILIVDDDSDGSVSLKLFLDALGYEAEVAEHGADSVPELDTKRSMATRGSGTVSTASRSMRVARCNTGKVPTAERSHIDDEEAHSSLPF
jgi:CheY-like chemotaxis protein